MFMLASMLSLSESAHGSSFPGVNGKIAFYAGAGYIQTVNGDGTGLSTLLSAGGGIEPAWSPDGKQLAFNSSGISAVMQDGTGLRDITTDGSDTESAWSPDANRIAFIRQTASGPANLDLMVANADGTGVTNLTTSFAGVNDPQWAPQGDVIAFISGLAISLIDPAGGAPVSVITGTDVRSFSWAPDGQKIAYMKGSNPGGEIWSVDRTGANNHMLTGGLNSGYELAWSPDGATIAYVANNASGRDLFVMGSNGSNPHALGLAPAVSPSPSIGWQPLPTADLQVTKTDTPDPANLDQNVTYTITVTNTGPHPAFDTSLTDTLPSGVTFVSAISTLGTCTGTATVTCQLGWMPDDAVATVTLVATANVVGTLSNTASVTHTNLTADPNTANNSDTEATQVFDPNDLLILTKSDSADPVIAGQNLTYAITVENIGGGATADAVTVTDPLPGGVSFVSSVPSTGSCAGTTTVECSLGSLNQGNAATVTIVVTTTNAGALSNTATVTTTSTDQKPSNNSATATTQVSKAASTITLKVTKTATKWTAKGAVGPALPGQKVTVTWYRKAGKNFSKLSSSKATLNPQSKFTASRSRQAGGSCKATATFPGDANHTPSTKTVTFPC